MDIPGLESRSTYSYAIMPVLSGGLMNTTGVFFLMFLTNIYRNFVDDGSLALVLALLTLYIVQRQTSGQQPGQITQWLLNSLGTLPARSPKLFQPLCRKIVGGILDSSCSYFHLNLPPTWKTRYEV